MDTALPMGRTDHGLVMQWTEVPDGRGGTRLQARWIDAAAAAHHDVPAAHAA